MAHLVARALLEAAGEDPTAAEADLDLVALATVADCVPLVGENRRLVREGLRVLGSTRKPGLQALMEVARVDPSGVDAGAIGFRLAPRINAAGRLHRADAGLELLLTADVQRARAIAAELDAVNTERRDVETRILFEAEAQVAATPPGAAAYVLAADGWHPGVIGIVASRIAERHHRPAVLIALDGDQGTGSGRSIPAFDLLAGLEAASADLLRHGGHRAAAGLTIERGRVDAFRAAFVAHAAAVLRPEDLVPRQRVDAVVPGDALHIGLAEELDRLAPFGMGNPEPCLLVPSALLADPRPLGEGRHVAFALAAGGARSRCVAFGRGGSLPAAPATPVDAAVRLEINRYNGAVEPRLVLRHARPADPAPITVVGEPRFADAVLAELDRPLAAAAGAEAELDRPPAPGGGGEAELHRGLGPPTDPPGLARQPRPGRVARREICDNRDGGIAGLLGDLVAGGGSVLAVAAHAERRARALQNRVGGFAVTSWAALEADPALATRPRARRRGRPAVRPHAQRALAARLPGAGWTHLAWGEPEREFARRVLAWELDLRPHLEAVYRALLAAPELARRAARRGAARGGGAVAHRGARRPVAARARGARTCHGRPRAARGPPRAGAARTELERSPAFRAYRRRLADGARCAGHPPARSATRGPDDARRARTGARGLSGDPRPAATATFAYGGLVGRRSEPARGTFSGREIAVKAGYVEVLQPHARPSDPPPYKPAVRKRAIPHRGRRGPRPPVDHHPAQRPPDGRWAGAPR